MSGSTITSIQTNPIKTEVVEEENDSHKAQFTNMVRFLIILIY